MVVLVISVALGVHTMLGPGCPMMDLRCLFHVRIVVDMQAVPPMVMVMVTFNALVEEEPMIPILTTSPLLECPVVAVLEERVVVPTLVLRPRRLIIMAQDS